MKAPKVQPKNIPECLREIDSWLLWRLVKGKKADGSETWLKVPYYADGTKRRGVLGTKVDRAKLVSLKQAMEVYRNGHFAGVGFATMPEYPLTILDLDKCIDDEGGLSAFAKRVLKTGTYVEFSPSGTGLRAVYTGEAICAGKRNGHIESGERVEIYCGSAFVTITGNVVSASENIEPIDLPKTIKRALQPVVESGLASAPTERDDDAIVPIEDGPVPEMTIGHAKVILDKLPETWGRPGEGTWYRVAAALHHQFDGSDEAYALLDEWSQGIDGYDSENNQKRWSAGFSHEAGRHGLTTMRNLVFESIQNGGLKVKPETMQKWGLARKVRNVDEDDFSDLDDIDTPKSMLPEYSELRQMINIRHMVDKRAKPIDWLVQDMVPRGTVSFLAGGSGTSKSFFALQLACRAATGEIKDFGGLMFKDGGFRTLYFAYEDNANLLHHRIRAIASNLAESLDVLGDYDEDDEGPLSNNEEFKEAISSNLFVLPAEVLDSGDWQFATRAKKWDEVVVTGLADYLRVFIEQEGIDLLVFDTGSEIHSVDENVAPDMVVVMRALRQLAAGANIGVLVLQHVQKDIWSKRLAEINQASIRGSSVLVDKSRNVFMLARIPLADVASFGLPNAPESHEDYVVLKHVKANMGAYVPLKVFQRTGNGTLWYRPDMVQEIITPADASSAKKERKVSEFTETEENMWQFIHEKNNEGEYPNSTAVRIWGLKNKLSADATNLAYVSLQNEGRIVEQRVRGAKQNEKRWRAVDPNAKPDKDDPPASAWDASGLNGHSHH